MIPGDELAFIESLKKREDESAFIESLTEREVKECRLICRLILNKIEDSCSANLLMTNYFKDLILAWEKELAKQEAIKKKE